jgi:thiol-disulfide isomerase/thioredoxin
MLGRTVLGGALVALVGIAVGQEAPGIPVGTVAPPLEGTKWITADGKDPDLKNKVYLVDFWFERCPPCNAAIPGIKELAAKYAKDGLIVVGPSLDAEDGVMRFREKHKIEYPLLVSARKTATAYQVRGYPTMFLVGKDGKVLWKGHFKNDSLIKAIEAALGKTAS